MNIRVSHHPAQHILVDFASGALDSASSLCVSAHLHFCEHCRQQVRQMTALGAQLLHSIEPVEVSSDLLDKVMANIDSSPKHHIESTPTQSGEEFPHVVERLLSQVDGRPRWRKLSASLDTAKLQTGQARYEVALQRICAGGKTILHDHGGREYTVVLQGSFSDENGVYKEGDFLLKNPGEKHQPMGALNGDCICLTALEAPIRVAGLKGLFLRPWLSINPG